MWLDTELENDLNAKLALISELETDIKGIKRVGREQNKALTGLNNEGVSDEYVDKVKEQVTNRKQDFK